ncbi:MAG TPA: hypothetical protein VKM93_06935 [Terriglobia bacterium]|nr:hypothetical protein [Terriglobia bacterium]
MEKKKFISILSRGNMTLLDAQAPKPPNKFLKILPLLIIIVVVLGSLLIWGFWNYPEERAVSRFLTTLEQGNFQQAYKLWQPSPSYSYDDFLRGWGEQGDYGKIREFEILHARSVGSSTAAVTVRINNIDPPIDLWVDRKTKGLAYAPPPD